MKIFLLTIDKKLPFIFDALKYFNIKYYLAIYHSFNFNKFYKKSRKAYKKDNLNDLSFNINKLKLKIYNPAKKNNDFNLPLDYLTLVKKIAIEVDLKFKDTSNCFFLPKLKNDSKTKFTQDVEEIKNSTVEMIQLRDPFCISDLKLLFSYISEEIEEKFYGSYIFIDKVYIYRTLACRNEESGSFLWHFDNHPSTFSKVMIYLTDVDKNSGAMSVFMSDDSDVYKFKPLPGLVNPFYKSRINKEKINKINKNNNFSPFFLEGKQGTAVLFSENILHKANICKEKKYRDVIVLQMKPAMSKESSILNTDKAGSFNHEDVLLTPSIISQRKKKIMASG